MKRSGYARRILAAVLTLTLLLGLALPAGAVGKSDIIHPAFVQVEGSETDATLPGEAAEELEEPQYKDTDQVRVSIVLKEKSTVQAGFSTQAIAANPAAIQYRDKLETSQAAVTAAIERKVLNGEALDVVWNLTLAANIISANVPYGKVEEIEKIPGVQDVVLEMQYSAPVAQKEADASPNMAISTQMSGTNAVWQLGYTGAGARIAVIDTGLDMDHQSFDASAFDYAIAEDAQKAGMSVEEFIREKDLLDAAEIAQVLPQLNAHRRRPNITAEEFYASTKVPFGYNYVDNSLYLTHDEDTQGGHGSHVAGIANANRYIPDGEGSYVEAASSVHVVGNAPDSQILVMKVFGMSGGAFDSDYFAALEDAIILGCDSVNLSLGSNYAGLVRSEVYQKLLDALEKTNTVMVVANGNNNHWAEYSGPQNLYAEDVNLSTAGSPATYANTLAVASADNDGLIGSYLELANTQMFYAETLSWQDPMRSLDTTGNGTEYEYVFIDGIGLAEDYEGIDLSGKLVFCSRGKTTFAEKANTATELGAAAIIIYNNMPGTINMDLSEYFYLQPCVSITQEQGAMVKAVGTPSQTGAGLNYYTGTIAVHSEIIANYYESPYLTMSSFSSWGIPSDLSMKPEITAPGGNILSVDGAAWDSTAYTSMSGTSMAAPQVAGLTALMMQYLEEQLLSQPGLTNRALTQSLLMSTAKPMFEEASGYYYSILRQGAGLAAVDQAIGAASYVLVDGQPDGKVKAELKDDPERTGVYSFSFTLHDLRGQDTPYTLSADLFTQGVFEDYIDKDQTELGLYMDTLTEAMDAQVTFLVDGKAVTPVRDLSRYDFNGDGVADHADAQLLMDHVILGAELTANQDSADLNEDGAVTSYDVHELLQMLNSGVVTVPASGSVTVTVEMRLTDSQKAKLDQNFANGAYVEGFVYATPAPTAEGLILPTHSIPVLGFYGNWSDPSMLDVGSYQTYDTGEETRQFYVAGFANSLLKQPKGKAGTQYYVGGNIMVPDAVYMPERNAMNNLRGDLLDTWALTPIRNAGNARITIRNIDTQEILQQEELGSVLAAFYVPSVYAWGNNAVHLPVKYKGEGLPEGTHLELTLELAPELYVQKDGTTNWDALGKGAIRTVPLTIDNTAPEILEISYNLVSNTMTVTARDNQYIAGVSLMSSGGFNTLSMTGSNQETAGETAFFQLDLSEVNGKYFWLQATDYAGNTSIYQVELPLGTQPEPPDAFAFELFSNQLVSFDLSKNPEQGYSYTPAETMLGMLAPEETFYAASDVYGLIYAATNEGHLYVIDTEHPADMIYVGAMGLQLTDLAFNRADDTLYGVTKEGELYAVDRMTANVQYIGQIGFETNTLACDDQGNFYCIIYGTNWANVYESGDLCRFTLETLSNPELLTRSFEKNCEVQALEWNPNDNHIYWASYYRFYSHGGLIEHLYNDIYMFDLENQTTHRSGISSATLTAKEYRHLSCLTLPKKGAAVQWPAPAEGVAGVQLEETALTLIQGEEKLLRAAVQPWSVTDRSVTWTSSNPSIASVDQDGNITAHSNGEATITATAVADPSKSVSCTVTVENPQVLLQGVVQTPSGESRLFTWDMRNSDSWTAGSALDMAVSAAAMELNSKNLYVVDAKRNEHSEFLTHQVDPVTGEILATANSGVSSPMWSMVPCNLFSTAENPQIMWFYDTYLSAPMDPMNPTFWMTTPQVSKSGASTFVAMASGGATTFTGSIGTLSTDLLYLLDDLGNIWKAYVYASRGSYAIDYETVPYVSTDLSDLDFRVRDEQMNCSMWADQESGTLFLSYYTGSTTQIWRLTYNAFTNSYESTLLGDMGEGVGPVALYDAQVFGAEPAALPQPEFSTETQTFAPMETLTTESEPALADGSLQSAISVASEEQEPSDLVTLPLTAAPGQTNGVIELTYDPALLTLESVQGQADVISYQHNDGSVKLGYAWAAGAAEGAAYATLTFRGKDLCTADVTLRELERNDQAVDQKTTLTLDFGHLWSDWTVTKEPTCTEPGEKTRTCSRCDAVETEAIAAYPCPSEAFTDLDTNRWYHEYTDYVIRHGLMEGMGDGKFAPEAKLTRGMLVTTLYRLAGEPEVTEPTTFQDVSEGRYFSDAIAWAEDVGIAKGITETRFAPDHTITREQAVTFLYRYVTEYLKETPATGGNLSSFTDAGSVSDYAKTAMSWATAQGLLEGYGDGTIGPKNPVTRAQMAKFLTILALET